MYGIYEIEMIGFWRVENGIQTAGNYKLLGSFKIAVSVSFLNADEVIIFAIVKHAHAVIVANLSTRKFF